MTSQHPDDFPKDEQSLLQHVREHSSAEPSAAMDAYILATAAKAVAPTSRSQRLSHWLFALKPGQRLGWSVGFASLATIGLGLSLTWRSLEPPSQVYDQPLPMAVQQAPATLSAERASAPALEEKKQSVPAPAIVQPSPAKAERRVMADHADVAGQLSESVPVNATAKTQAESARKAGVDQAAGYAPAAKAELPLHEALQQVLLLRSQGEETDAETQLAALRQRYPQQDLDAQLKQLQLRQPIEETPAP